MAVSRPAFPSEPNLRRLGVGGGGGGGGDRTLRAQLVIALVLGFAILAVLLYVIRRPSPAVSAVDAGTDAGAVMAKPDAGRVVKTKVEPAKAEPMEKVRLGSVQRVKCSASPNRRGNEGNLCDSLPFFEEALTQAIKGATECAPRTGKEGTLNYVLTVDFNSKRIHVFPGQSGQWRGPQARRATQCVLRALPAPQWEAIPHQYRYYMIAILATYPVSDPLEPFPKFE